MLENFVYGDTPDATAANSLVQALFSLGDEFDVSLYQLSAQHDIRPLVLRTLLTYLELEGYLQGGTPFYADYKFKPLHSSTEILSGFKGARREFLAGLFRCGVKGRTWFSLDPTSAAKQLGTELNRVVRALDWLGEQQMLEVKVSGVQHRYQRCREPDSLEGLAADLYQRNNCLFW